ncbi:Metal tolerance protein 11 [Abeliophyllum distichum]|uniref:Metal tolerance protein 11 n=1 Tax=Abeliophyllum distichum TaxID=126358 RepID=A0ABD1NZF0_9LAMI
MGRSKYFFLVCLQGNGDRLSLEIPKGILVFASVMATLGLQIILESVRTLVSDDDEFNLTKEQEQWVIGIMLSVTLVKLLLFVYCRTFANEIVKAYAQDHFFDVITKTIFTFFQIRKGKGKEKNDPKLHRGGDRDKAYK